MSLIETTHPFWDRRAQFPMKSVCVCGGGGVHGSATWRALRGWGHLSEARALSLSWLHLCGQRGGSHLGHPVTLCSDSSFLSKIGAITNLVPKNKSLCQMVENKKRQASSCSYLDKTEIGTREGRGKSLASHLKMHITGFLEVYLSQLSWVFLYPTLTQLTGFRKGACYTHFVVKSSGLSKTVTKLELAHRALQLQSKTLLHRNRNDQHLEFRFSIHCDALDNRSYCV